MKTKAQVDKIRAALERGEKLTPVRALRQFGCFRLAARVKELRDAGMPIQTEKCRTKDGATVARYTLR